MAHFSQPLAIPGRHRLNFSWLLKLRWAQIAGQVVTIFGVRWFFALELPMVPLVMLVALGGISNLVGELWFRSHPQVAERHLAGVMMLDVALLTALLYFTGGPDNPFSFLYLVQIALATVVLHAHLTWLLVVLSLGSFALLLMTHRPLSGQSDIHAPGAWVALAVAAAFIVHFLRRITTTLSQRERELTQAHQLASRQGQLASLATMAAGAAHELATPLGTIALIAKELERTMLRRNDASTLIEDVQLIRQQTSRCRGILDQMAAGAGEHPGESEEMVTVGDWVREALVGTRGQPSLRVDLAGGVANTELSLRPRAMIRALRNLITNAQDASPAEREVLVAATRAKDAVIVEVIDRGTGMESQIMARASEPFFTTKEPGAGMGLGLFLTRTVVESIGGTLAIESTPGKGTCVILTLPIFS